MAKQGVTSQHSRNGRTSSPKLFVYLLIAFGLVFIIFQILSLQFPPPSPSPSPPNTWYFMQRLQDAIQVNTTVETAERCRLEMNSISSKLRDAVTFLPLKDLRFANTAQQGHTWFMSSLYDTQEAGEVQYQQFPSDASEGRLLCLKGRDTHDGSWNSYALAWPEAFPENATLVKGLTFVSYNHYNYDNIWHGLSAMVPFVAWHIKHNCESPTRWVLYHWGELRLKMGPWLRTLMEATYGGPLHLEGFDHDDNDDNPSCFEKAVVMRHNEGGMSRQRRIEVYDLLRCKARISCNVSIEGRLADVDDKGIPVIGMTMLMRTGARSFRNDSVVISIFEEECNKVKACQFRVAYSNNLTFCEQVKLMSLTDVLISPHGAQLTNIFFMDKNSSVLEFFPKGWLKNAGVGQYVYHWIASWSGMKHQGAWRDPDGKKCPYPEDDRRCMSLYKGGTIGYNRTHFSEWSRSVLNEVRLRKEEEALMLKNTFSLGSTCGCNWGLFFRGL